MDKKLLLNLYYCLVFSHLSYGVQAWGSACDTYLNELRVIQNKAVRILSGNQYFQIYGQAPGPLPSSTPLYKELKILKLHDIYRFNIAKFVYQTLCKDSPVIFSNWFTYTHMVHTHATTSATSIIREHYFDVGTEHQTYTLYVNRGNLVHYGKKMIRVSGPLIWNDLPPDIQDASSIFTFKSYLKNHFIDKYVEDD